MALSCYSKVGQIKHRDKPIDKFADRRLMPRVILQDKIKSIKFGAVLVSGDLNYFIKYGLPLINSYNKNLIDTALIINCVDFKLSTAIALVRKYFGEKVAELLYFVKTDFSVFGNTRPEVKLAYLKTIRFYIADLIRKQVDIPIVISDIDALFTSKGFDKEFVDLNKSLTTFGVGATNDFLGTSLFNTGLTNYPWRTVKAGFTYFKEGNQGKIALSRIVHMLFNLSDSIPPHDELKLYRAYYGDQLSILFTALELTAAPQEMGHYAKCIIPLKSKIITFGKDPNDGCLWIPPASMRDENKFHLN